MLICQMARYYRARGMNLVEAMRALYEDYGYYENGAVSFYKEGADGARRIVQLMEGLRSQPPASIAGLAVEGVVDYGPGVGGLPPANVLAFSLEGGQKFLVRPSGTEPKIKAYLFAMAPDQATACSISDALSQAATEMLG